MVTQAPAPPLRSHADRADDGFSGNAADNAALVTELREKLATARLGGPARAR